MYRDATMKIKGLIAKQLLKLQWPQTLLMFYLRTRLYDQLPILQWRRRKEVFSGDELNEVVDYF